MSAGLSGAAIEVLCRWKVRGRRVRHRCQPIGTSPCTPVVAMHELSIAAALVDLACDAAARLRVPRIEAVHVAVGPLAGVVEEALRFSFGLVAEGTPVEHAALCLEHVPLVVYCDACSDERTLASPQHLRCPACGGPTPEIRRGRDLQLVAVEVPDVPDCGDSPEHPEEERSARR